MSVLIEVVGGTALTVALFVVCELAGWWMDHPDLREMRRERRPYEAMRRVTRPR